MLPSAQTREAPSAAAASAAARVFGQTPMVPSDPRMAARAGEEILRERPDEDDAIQAGRGEAGLGVENDRPGIGALAFPEADRRAIRGAEAEGLPEFCDGRRFRQGERPAGVDGLAALHVPGQRGGVAVRFVLHIETVGRKAALAGRRARHRGPRRPPRQIRIGKDQAQADPVPVGAEDLMGRGLRGGNVRWFHPSRKRQWRPPGRASFPAEARGEFHPGPHGRGQSLHEGLCFRQPASGKFAQVLGAEQKAAHETLQRGMRRIAAHDMQADARARSRGNIGRRARWKESRISSWPNSSRSSSRNAGRSRGRAAARSPGRLPPADRARSAVEEGGSSRRCAQHFVRGAGTPAGQRRGVAAQQFEAPLLADGQVAGLEAEDRAEIRQVVNARAPRFLPGRTSWPGCGIDHQHAHPGRRPCMPARPRV